MIKPVTLVSLMSLLSAFGLSAATIDVGQPAPAPTVVIHTGERVNLAEVYAKGPVLVYFYPKSDTPGCTAQACNIRDHFADLVDRGITVFGVSADSVAAQQAFVEKYQLPFSIVADDKLELGNAFGVARFMGMAFKRQSFLIVDGKIAWRDLNATPRNQTEDALSALTQIRVRSAGQ